MMLLFCIIGAVPLLSAAYTWPNYIMDELEHLLVDGGGFNQGGVKSAITPCTNYVQGDQLLGRETAAQWQRVAFPSEQDDFSTADVTAGTGGIDASIGFETLRPENSGSAMNDTIGFFSSFFNAYVSMADLISLGVVSAVAGCSSPVVYIPLRGGRVDATEGGPYGVPEPETSVEETLSELLTAGFNHSEAIALTACGHTMGSVHHGGFPQVVPESAVTPNNTGGGIHFDATPGVFDVDVVNEYLTGTGQKGGALVTTDNVTVRSDLRLYTSDGNITMQNLAISSQHFVATCIELYGRMINTVPAGVILTEEISPNTVKPVQLQFTLDGAGDLMFSGYIRLLSSAWSENAVIRILWTSRVGTISGSVSATLSEYGTSTFGNTYYHRFTTLVDPEVGISSFVLYVQEGATEITYDNGGSGYAVQDSVLYSPAESNVTSDGLIVTAAVLTSLEPNNIYAVLSVPTAQDGTLSPKITTNTLALAANSVRGNYTLYTGSTTLTLLNVNETSVDIVAVTAEGVTLKDEFRKLKSTFL